MARKRKSRTIAQVAREAARRERIASGNLGRPTQRIPDQKKAAAKSACRKTNQRDW